MGKPDIKKIPIEELRKDKQESLEDISTCKEALFIGVTQCGSGSVQERLDVNNGIVKTIDNELQRRESVTNGKAEC